MDFDSGQKIGQGNPQLRRLLEIMIQLRSGKRLTSAELANISGVHRRTVLRDLASLKRMGYVIGYEAVTQRYFALHAPESDRSTG